MNKYKIIIIFSLMFGIGISSGCRGGRYNITSEKKSSMIIAVKDYGEGYIMKNEDDRFLVVGANAMEEYNQLNAIWITVSKTEEIYNKLELGKGVRFVSDGPTFTSYPGIGGIKITDVIEGEYPGAKSTEMDIIKEALDVIKDISDSNTYLCGVNDIKLSNGLWKITMMKHEIVKDELTYYNIEINDYNKKIEKIIVGE